MPRVKSIYRYPIKSLAGQALEQVALEAGRAMPGDRAFALTNGQWDAIQTPIAARPKRDFLTLMRHEELASLTWHWDAAEQKPRVQALSAPSARSEAGSGKLHQLADLLIEHLGLPAAFRPQCVKALPGQNFSDVATVSDSLMNSISFVNLATVEDLSRTLGIGIDPLRFRANIYFDGVPAWGELAWMNREFMVGTARLQVVMRTRRCAAPGVNPSTARRDLAFPALLLSTPGRGDLGFYAVVRAQGVVTRGASMQIHPATIADSDFSDHLPDARHQHG